MNQGAKANSSGKTLEGAVTAALQGKGFAQVKYREWEKHKEMYGSELLLSNVPFTSIYGGKSNTEFLLVSRKSGLAVRIECKWQQSSGSVDEKLPFMYLNTIEAMPEKDIIILIDGGGFRDGALAWLRDAVAKKKYMGDAGVDKNVQVFTISDFFTWANKTFD